jgi:uncharacterized RDD family membrane protein YckC
MVWYYVKDGARQGPVEEAEFNRLVGQAVVRPDTLVWSEGMPDWKPYSTVAPGGSALYSETAAAPPVAAASPVQPQAESPVHETSPEPVIRESSPEPVHETYPEPGMAVTPAPAQAVAAPVVAVEGQAHFCSQCGRQYPSEELVRFGAATVCANCKDTYAQRLRETGQVAGTRVYAGFWIRFCAILIDGIALWMVNFAIQTVLGTARISNPNDLSNLPHLMGLIGVSFILSTAVSLFYEAFFLVQYGATPGKMIFRLKVITPDGGPISWGRAIGRFFARYLSGITLLIGYIMAGFDSEKRALHDYLAGTRVIRTA